MKLSEKEMQEILAKVEENLRLRRLSENTILNYLYDIKFFFKNCTYSGDLKDFTEDDFIDYVKKEFLDKEKTANTYNAHIAAIKKMFIVCYRKAFINDLIPRAKQSKKLPIIIPINEFNDILKKEKNIEHCCWLLLSYYCGLRACEIGNVKIENIDSKNNSLRITGKGNKERITILPNDVIICLRKYYVYKKMKKTTGYLFEGNKNNEHVNSKTVVNYFINLKKRYNLNSRYTYHTLRHSFATNYIMNGGKLEELQIMMGHKNIVTTVIYLHLALNFKKIIEKQHHE